MKLRTQKEDTRDIKHIKRTREKQTSNPEQKTNIGKETIRIKTRQVCNKINTEKKRYITILTKKCVLKQIELKQKK